MKDVFKFCFLFLAIIFFVMLSNLVFGRLTQSDANSEKAMVSVDFLEIQLAPSRVGIDQRVAFSLKNNSTVQLQVYNCNAGCTRSGCVEVETHFPVSLLPGESLVLNVVFHPTRKGVIDAPLAVYTNNATQSELILRITGNVISN